MPISRDPATKKTASARESDGSTHHPASCWHVGQSCLHGMMIAHIPTVARAQLKSDEYQICVQNDHLRLGPASKALGAGF